MYEILMWIFLYLWVGTTWIHWDYWKFTFDTHPTRAAKLFSVLIWPVQLVIGSLIVVFEFMDGPI